MLATSQASTQGTVAPASVPTLSKTEETEEYGRVGFAPLRHCILLG
ncbi:hypothetical protein [Streptomyces caniferus]